ncbi:MAX gene-associated protein isoform X2 [Neopsephotus bourkii]|uniref:MAX gene-associated protein isoform X2 n=1 Tax=Neopsephotus bourkii TaxID=309878 RepID=UPI002AA51F10|nr:MAX gene-associated protein isoform X2 [Neopsephotus bourkii]
MEKQQLVLGSQDSGTVSGAAPAFFVILKQQQGNGKADQGILVANHDACALASSVSIPVKPKVKTCLPADCVSGGITVTLDNNSMWNEFYHRNTEMILTKQGRRMFPYCRYWITGLDVSRKYILVMDISPVDNHRYKWNGRWWEPSGKAEPHVLGRVFIHPESPSTGQYWMHQPVSFYKLKLTNNTLDQEGHIILHSMHRYLPRLHLVPADKATEVIQLNGPGVHTFTFPQTEFFAVTAYQNIQITQLKIDYNPFAKGFRDDGLNSRPQRDMKQNSNLDLEGGDVFSAAGIRGRPSEVDALDLHQRSLDASFTGQNSSDTDIDKDSFNAERDFLGFLDTDLSSGDMPKLKQEVSESPVASSYESSSRVASPLDPNGHFNVVIKEEPIDDYDYESGICTQGVSVKQEDTDEETDEYSNTDDDDPILQKHLMRRSETDGTDGEFRSRKRVLNSPSGVAKAKMLKLDSGKMPVVYLEPCAVTKSTVKISELPETMLSSCKKDKSPFSAMLDPLPVCFENHKGSCSGTDAVTEELVMKKESSGNKVSQKYSSVREAQWALSKSPNFNLRGSVSCQFSAKEICGRKRSGILKSPMSLRGSGSNQNTLSSVTTKRGRPRKLRISKAGRPPKGIGKAVITSKNASLGPGNILPDVKPDLEDVDGVLFVSFASKEALDIHTVDKAGGGEESRNFQAPLLTTNDPDCQARIQVLEKELMEELKTLRHKQVIHPSLQEVGLKLNSVDPTVSIDLKYLGVQLPLSYSTYSLWSYPGTNPNSPDTGFPFVSRTGKTNDFTKIKGWRGKLHGASRNEGGSSEGSLKNRSAFCSDKLDEYLENEGKLMETSMGFSSSAPASPVVYQLPTKSTSYVRTLDSVLKKQSTTVPSTSYMFKPVPLSSTSRKTKSQNRQTSTNRVKSYKPILPSPFTAKQKQNISAFGEKAAKSASNTSVTNQAGGFMMSPVDENTLPKQISLRQAPQQQQAPRPPGLSKSQVKLMDLEDCALWDGKPRTYITEERADISLATLLTAQASLKNKPIHKIIRRRAPPCNNDFCRLGCICASLALEKRQPTHCRRPDCMFGCTCLKRKVMLVKGGSKHKRIMKKAMRGNLTFCGTEEDQQEDEDGEEEGDGEEDELKQKEKKKRRRVEYTICDSEPEQPLRNCPLWVKVEGEVDPEPIYIPTPSVIEPVKSVVPPNQEVLPSSKHRSSSGMKSGRVYTPKPNPVIREEDKDPVYLYFESMMTCARVRVYERKREEKKQQKDKSNSQSPKVKEEPEPDPQPPEKATCEADKDTDKSGEKSWCSSRSEGYSSSTSYVHHTTPGGPAKLIEIISDCSLEEDNNKILTILSQQTNNKAPQCLKVGSFTIELASEIKAKDENHRPAYSRMKISVPSYQEKDETPEIPVLETPDSGEPPCKSPENLQVFKGNPLNRLENLHGGKGLPFYAGLSPAGKMIVHSCKANMSPLGFIQVNDKRFPQAKLLLGQMGALHPASRLAACITGRLRHTVLDISALSAVISKVDSTAKAAASGTPSVQVPTTSTPKTTSSTSTTSTPTVTTLKTHVPAQRQIAVRPSPGGVFAQFVMSKAGALQQKVPGASTRQPVSGAQKFSIKPTPIMVVTPVVPAKLSAAQSTVSPGVTTVTTTSPVIVESISAAASSVTTPGQTRANEPVCSPAITVTAVPATSGVDVFTTPSSTTPTATVNTGKATGSVVPAATESLPKTVVTTPTVTCPVVTTSTATVVLTTAVTAASVVTTPTCSSGSVPIILSGVSSSPSLTPKKEDATAQGINKTSQMSPGTEKRVGPRLLLIPVHQTSPALRPLNSMQLAQRQRMVLQPLRNPGGMNLFRHPNGQIIQLVPLQQFRATGAQTNVQPVMFRNPGSVVGIRLPTPSKPPESPASPPSSVSSTSPATNSAAQTAVPKLSPTSNVATQASSPLPSVPSFVSQAGTLTLRIAPTAGSVTNQTASESKITCSSGGLPATTANLIALQSGSFALLQLPGQKTVPNSILNHFASLQLKKNYRKICKKEEPDVAQQENEKASRPDDAVESEFTVSDRKQKENELSINQSNNVEESASGTVAPDSNSTALEMVEKDSKVLESSCDDSTSSQHDVSTDVISSDHSYISEKPNDEEEKEDSLTSETVVKAFSTNSEAVCGSSDQSLAAPLGNAHQQSLEDQESVQLKNHMNEQTCVEQEEKPVKEEEGDEHTQMKEDKASSEQSQSQQEQGTQLENMGLNETEPFQGKECHGDAVQLDTERKDNRGFAEAESTEEKLGMKCDTSSAKEQGDASGEEHTAGTKEGKANIAGQGGSSNNKEQALFDSQEELKTGHDIVTHVNSSWSKISSIVPPLENKSEVDNKADIADFLIPEEKTQELRHPKMPTLGITADGMEEEEEDDDEEDEKTDDSADEMLDGASDFPSEEEIDVEKVQKHQFWNRKLKTVAEAFAHYRQTHTANERRRRNEMRDLFEKLKRALGLHGLPKVSKCYILKQAYEEIQGLTDQADKFIGQKNLLMRKQNVLIRKVSKLSGKTEEVVLKKLEYIYAKQKAVEAQKKKEVEPQEPAVTSAASTKQEETSAPFRELPEVAMTNRRGKPLILARKGVRATEDTSSSLALTAASLVMTPQGQVLTLKSPLVPGQVAAVPSTLLQAELKPRAVTTAMTAQPGIASVMIQLPGSTVPVQVKGILTNSTIPITLSAVAGNPVPSAVVSATEPHPESEDSFMMPKIVNVTSLAAEVSMGVNLNSNDSFNTTAAVGAQASEKPVVASVESRKSDSILSEEKAKLCPGDSGGDGRSTTGPTKVFLENKDGFPQLRNVSCAKEPPESFSKKLCLGEFVGSQARRKDSDPGGERLKPKELPFHKLQIKDSRIEMELRKVASAMEEAELDASELLSSIEESDDTDETLTSLLNEIAFLNQQLNDDASAMSELPSTLNSDFSHEDAEARRGASGDLTTAGGSSFQFGHLGGSFKDLAEVPDGGGSISPLLLHLEDDDLTDGEKNSGEPSSEDVLKIVIGAEMKDPLPNLAVTSSGNEKTVTALVETTNVTPPILQMKTNPEAGNADALWRPMPKLAPLGLKVPSLPVDSEGQSNKVMPLLAPVVAKLAPSGVKSSLPAAVQEGQDNRVMPALAPVVMKLTTTGTLPPNSAGK